MSKFKNIEKFLIIIAIIIIAIIAKPSIVHGVYFSGYSTGSQPLIESKTYYCIEHQDHFTAGTWKETSKTTIYSDSSSKQDRILAYILYKGYTSGNGGYNYKSKYQVAVWKWYYNNGKVNTKYPSDLSDDGLYEKATEKAKNSTTYSSGSSAITIGDNYKTISLTDGEGSFKIKSMTGTVTAVKVRFKDDSGNKKEITITTGSSGKNGWFALYSDSGYSTALNVENIKAKNMVYIKNLNSDGYKIKRIWITTTVSASGYKVVVHRYKKTNNSSSQQDLISATITKGADSSKTAKIKVTNGTDEPEDGELIVLKTGSYYDEDKTKQTVEIDSATFKLYSVTEGKWVTGSQSGEKTYTCTDFKSATEYKTGTTVTELEIGTYRIVETSADDLYYCNADGEIYMVGTSVTINGTASTTSGSIGKYSNTEYYMTPQITVEEDKTTTVTIENTRTSGDLTIIKRDKDDTSKVIQDVKIKIYYTSEANSASGGWLSYEDGEYSYDATFENATEFETDEGGAIELNEIKVGYYYIYETATGNSNYYLEDQPGFMTGEDPLGFAIANECAFLGVKTINYGNTYSNVVTARYDQYGAAKIEINKKDAADTSKSLEGAEFKIYAVLNDGTVGWLCGTADGEKTYVSDSNADGTTFTAGEEITNLRYGTYYFFETAVPTTDNNYAFKDQDGYMSTVEINGTQISPSTNEWAYKGSKELSQSNSGDTLDINITNNPEGSLQIGGTGDGEGKIDSITGEKLTGAEFKIYAVLEDETSGWVQKNYDDDGNELLKNYVTYDSTDTNLIYESEEVISRLRYGTYYIYETKAPETDTNYVLADQGDSYMQTEDNGETLPGTDDLAGADEEWVYIDAVVIDRELVVEQGYTLDNPYIIKTVTNNPEGSLQIGGDSEGGPGKVDAVTGEALTGEEFKIYAVLETSTLEDGEEESGWLYGGANDGNLKQYVEYDSASVYSSGEAITRLRYGTYYIYETKAPETDTNYVLADQEGYKQTEDSDGNTLLGTSDMEEAGDEWVYIDTVTINYELIASANYTLENPYITETVTNNPEGSLQIGGDSEGGSGKVDSVTGEALTGEEFKIYAVLETNTLEDEDEESGWLYGGANDGNLKQYVEYDSASVYTSGEAITRLRYGTYYIYETKAPETDTNYVLADQEGYKQTEDSDGNTLLGTSDMEEAGDEWVYIDTITINYELIASANYTLENPYITDTVTNRPEGSIELGGNGETEPSTGKVDTVTGEYIDNAKFQIYAVLENSTLADGEVESGWVSGPADDGNLKQYVEYEDADEEDITYSSGDVITRLRYGTYYIYEVEVPNDDYDIRDQDGYHTSSGAENDGHEDLGDSDWVYIGAVTLTYDNDNEKILATYVGRETEGNDEASGDYTLDDGYGTPAIANNPKGKIQIEKVDETYNVLKLKGAEFVIYAELNSDDIENGWVSGDPADVKEYTSYSGASVYDTDDDGLTEVIEKLNYGTYYIYEITAPEGYDITKQDNYNVSPGGTAQTPNTDDWVYVASVEINVETLKEIYNTSLEEGGEVGIIPPFELTIENLKAVNELEGLVWNDKPDTKEDYSNYLYKADDGDTRDVELKGITVRLYLQGEDGRYYEAAKTETDADGRYTFSFDPDSENYCGIEVTYWDLVTAYVEFEYNNETYVVVDPFVGDDITINSKAQEEVMEEEELDDTNLLDDGDTSTPYNPGYAVTYQGGIAPEDEEDLTTINSILKNNEAVISGGDADLTTTPLTGYYEQDEDNTNHYKVTNINLGVQETVVPTYSVNETLAYVYITMNGYTYQYIFDGTSTIDGQSIESYYVPTVNKQMDSRTFGFSVYPSDIAYNALNTDSKMKVYVVYRIDVYNSTTLTIDDIYNEQALYLTSLTNEYDNDRYELSNYTDNNYDEAVKNDIGLWSGSDGNVSYSVNNANSKYVGGVKAGETVSSYVEFEIKEEALNKLLNDEWDSDQLKTAASVAYAEGYHDYLRTDNVWKDQDNGSASEYSERITAQRGYDTENREGEEYFTHKSITIAEQSGALYINVSLGETRTISGTVYEDDEELETDDEGNSTKTGVGDGIIDDEEEENRGSAVTVELLNATASINEDGTVNMNNLTQATLYGSDDSGNATTELAETTTTGGTYSFEGVVPGYYFIRFTYGDGSQEIVDADGNHIDDLSSIDYKSTIINTDEDEAGTIISEALENSYDTSGNTYVSTWSDYINILTAYYNGTTGENTEEAIKILEWYKQLYESSENSYNTATDNLTADSARETMSNYVYTSEGVYDKDPTEGGTLIAYYDENDTLVTETGEEFKLNVDSYTPVISISIENDTEKSNDVDYSTYDSDGDSNTNAEYFSSLHKSAYSGFNLGVIKQVETEIDVDKQITNVRLTTQTGSTIVDANPATSDSVYLSALDSYTAGSKYAKLEINPDIIYGSTVEIEYTVRVTNNSTQTYDTAEWNIYGTAGDEEEKSTVTVEELQDVLDEKYGANLLDETTMEQFVEDVDGSPIYENELEEIYGEDKVLTWSTSSKYLDEDGNETTTNNVYFTGFYQTKSGQSNVITYTASSLLEADDDTAYGNTAQVVALGLSGYKTLTTSYEWDDSDSTTLTISPTTGEYRSNTYWVAGAIGLVVLAAGLVLLKKKVLDKN